MRVEEFYNVIPKLPGVRVFEFTDNLEAARRLLEFALERDFELEIVTFEEELLEPLKEIAGERARVRAIDEGKERYNQRQLQYDTIFVDMDISKLDDFVMFIRKVYRIMKNAGNLVMPVDKRDKERVIESMIEWNYVAINDTELEGDMVLITAKKLHGWEKV